MNRLKFAFLATLFLCPSWNAANAQDGGQSSPAPQIPTITVSSNLVLVPALVKSKTGQIIFSLTADDFILTDDGIRQPVQMEPDTLSQPLALAVIVQIGGLGASHLVDYHHLGAVLDALIGGVPHRVAVISFDGLPRLELDFTANTDAAALKIAALHEGDASVAILDTLKFGIDLLRRQPPEYRRAVLLLSETLDNGSYTSIDEAVRAVEDSNIFVYSFAFSSTKAMAAHEGAKLPGGSSTKQPYAPGGCMSKDPKADPDAHGNRGVQALDCVSDLLPPLRLARMAFLAAKDGLKRNVPKSVAELTGGEYFVFKDATTLTRHLITISNHVPNYYVLSFRPQSPRLGPHALELRVKDRPGYEVKTRKGYWVDPVADAKE